MKAKELVKQLGTILVVGAHPDDETFLAAGILYLAVQNGQSVACVTATHGESGTQNEQKWPASTLGAVRTNELQAALEVLGVEQHFWFDYADGGCASVDAEQAVERLADIIGQVKPDTVLTFGSEGLTGHLDHAAVSGWSAMAVRRAGVSIKVYCAVVAAEQYEKYLRHADEKLNIFFNIDNPPICEPAECDLYVELPEDVCRVKCHALRAMPSQTQRMMEVFDEEFLCNAFSVEAFKEDRV